MDDSIIKTGFSETKLCKTDSLLYAILSELVYYSINLLNERQIQDKSDQVT